MHTINIVESEFYDEERNRFIRIPSRKIVIEHSLVSISKWEQKWHKPFFNTDFTREELLDYIRCMTITQNVDPNTYLGISGEEMKKVREYMNDPATATTIKEKPGKPKPKRNVSQIITSELIYGWMIQYGVPMECQKWHVNRLIMLIRVCQELQGTEKMSKKDLYKQNRALNAARKAKYHTRG